MLSSLQMSLFKNGFNKTPPKKHPHHTLSEYNIYLHTLNLSHKYLKKAKKSLKNIYTTHTHIIYTIRDEIYSAIY